MSLSIFVKTPFMMRRLRRNRFLKPSELRELQNRKLRVLIKNSYSNVAYYHSLFKNANMTPNDINTVEDLHKIPVSTKEDIRDLPIEATTAKNVDLSKCYRLATSGTSGVPIKLHWEKRARSMNYLIQYVWQLECGDKMRNKQVAIGAGWVSDKHRFQKIGIFRTRRISFFDDLQAQIEQIIEFKPKTMVAYPSCARELAKEIREKNVLGINLDFVFTGGELLDEYTRRLITETFDCEVYDKYGAHEVGSISLECPERTGYHIRSDFVLVEATRDGVSLSSGEEGDLTVTGLENCAMPFIRYNLEDLGMLLDDDCSCSNRFPLMRITSGRKSDIVRLPGGKVISALALYGSISQVSGIRRFQVVQEKVDRFTIKIVKDDRFIESSLEELNRRLRHALGQVEYEILSVDDIPKEKSGKFRQFISKVR